jgi:hypothetical protein
MTGGSGAGIGAVGEHAFAQSGNAGARSRGEQDPPNYYLLALACSRAPQAFSREDRTI